MRHFGAVLGSSLQLKAFKFSFGQFRCNLSQLTAVWAVQVQFGAAHMQFEVVKCSPDALGSVWRSSGKLWTALYILGQFTAALGSSVLLDYTSEAKVLL